MDKYLTNRRMDSETNPQEKNKNLHSVYNGRGS